MSILASLAALLVVVGPQVLIPKPVQSLSADGEFVYRTDKDVKTFIGDKKFVQEIDSRNLPDFAVEAAYSLVIGKKGIEIRSVTQTGAFYAQQDLAQMRAISDTLQCCTITDWPRFSHRGLMLDISRNFRGKDFILKQLDAMALMKMNSLHLHLTDDAGWRIEIDSYPELCRKAAWRIGEKWTEWRDLGRKYSLEGDPMASGGYLTKDDCREIVAYAAARHINIIPEIELPSHSGEVLAAYPNLACEKIVDGKAEPIMNSDVCPGNPDSYEFFETVLDEVMEIFPSQKIHIGGDEASRKGWAICPHCQQLMEKEGLKSVEELQSYMTRKIEEYLNSKGRSLLGWDEITEGGLAPEATVMSWRGTEAGLKAIAQGHDVIMSPNSNCYLDYPQDAPFAVPAAFGSYQPLSNVYAYDPEDSSVSEEDLHHLLGVQGNLWTEFVPTADHVEYMLYPRAFAIAEIGWTPQAERNYPDFRERALTLIKTLKSKGYNTFDLASEVGDRPESIHPFIHMAVGKKVTYNNGCKPSSGYRAGGETALSDGIYGGWGYKDDKWQGLLCDLDVTIDLGESKPVHYVGATFMTQKTAGIAFPDKVEVYISEDGTDFETAGEALCQLPEDAQTSGAYMLFAVPFNSDARYIRFVAKRKNLPGHAFLFVDEIVID